MNNILFDLQDLPDGDYVIEWWNTDKGTIMGKEKRTCKKGILSIKISEVFTDIACKIRRID